MTTARRIPKEIPIYPDREIQPDTPYTGAAELSLAQGISALVWRGAGNSRHYCFPSPDEAPLAQVTALSTATVFNIGDAAVTYEFGPYGVPWRVSEGFTQVVGILVVAAYGGNYTFEARLTSDDLIDAVAASNSAWRTGFYTPHNPWGAWQAEEYAWRKLSLASGRQQQLLFSHVIRFTPTLPATRVVQITPYVQITENNSLIALSGTAKLYLRSLTLIDVPDEEVPI